MSSDSKSRDPLVILSLTLAVMCLALGLSYAGPDEWVYSTSPEGQVTIVRVIESISVVWPAAFLASGFWLATATVMRKWVTYAHAVCAASWAGYGVALLVGPLMTVPPLPILTGAISIFLAPVHFACILLWKERGAQ